MKAADYRARLELRIMDLKERYDKIAKDDYAERGITLGKINAYYDAILLSYELED